MAYVGLNLHKETVQTSVTDDRGTKIPNASAQNSRKALEASLRKMPPDAMRFGAKLIHKSSNNSDALY